MRILFNNYFDNKGSAQGIMIDETLDALRKYHEVLLAQYGKKVESNVLSEYKRSTLRRNLGRYLNEPRRLISNAKLLFLERKLLEECAPDIVINLYNYLSFSMAILTKIMKIPHIVLMDSPVVYETKNVDKIHLHFPLIPELIEKRVLQSCDAVVTISDNLKDYFVERYGIAADKVHVIPNGVDIERFKPSVNSDRIISKYNLHHKLVVGFCGVFKGWNMGQVIDVINNIVERDIKVCFLIVGDGPKKTDVLNFIKRKGLDSLILTGYVPPEETPAFISAMDIAIAPYQLQGDFFYGSPMKILEYMACGKPMVTNSFGPIEAVVQDGYNGFLVEPGNNKLFSDIVVKLIKNRALRSKVGERARKTTLENYTWMHRATSISEICNQVVTAQESSGAENYA